MLSTPYQPKTRSICTLGIVLAAFALSAVVSTLGVSAGIVALTNAAFAM